MDKKRKLLADAHAARVRGQAAAQENLGGAASHERVVAVLGGVAAVADALPLGDLLALQCAFPRRAGVPARFYVAGGVTRTRRDGEPRRDALPLFGSDYVDARVRAAFEAVAGRRPPGSTDTLREALLAAARFVRGKGDHRVVVVLEGASEAAVQLRVEANGVVLHERACPRVRWAGGGGSRGLREYAVADGTTVALPRHVTATLMRGGGVYPDDFGSVGGPQALAVMAACKLLTESLLHRLAASLSPPAASGPRRHASGGA